MEWIEVRARTLEEARERALDALGVHESELEVEILAEPRRGLFGLRNTEAHIRARVKPLSREKPADRRRRRPREEQRPRRPRERAAAATNPPASRAAEPGDREPAGATTPGSDGASGTAKRRRRGGRGRSSRSSGGTGTAGTSPDERIATEEADAMTDPAEVADAAARSRAFAVGLLDAFELPGHVEVHTEEAAVECTIDGDGLGVLVGTRGATLAALEELLRDAVGHHAPGVRLHLDVAGYRARRRAALADFARRVAGEVTASGAAKALEPMSAADRKVVHDAIAELDGVDTVSDGVEPQRRVIIRPAAGGGTA
jgi:spoIIIJ-associated protein